ncbi:hypothetical protein KR51_00023940 [Rubidibacter lacunae KORDI 51-2]|uniref:Uncharacterized protein n=1 Tax=Rubidibacter lacunae KORDI 51-2 TaxID=582515 RepID=U5DN70_9CHRO|nr:hypothetical protein KR51_00023940 [Rubidibacter lacunae KORDI 51-2]
MFLRHISKNIFELTKLIANYTFKDNTEHMFAEPAIWTKIIFINLACTYQSVNFFIKVEIVAIVSQVEIHPGSLRWMCVLEELALAVCRPKVEPWQ